MTKEIESGAEQRQMDWQLTSLGPNQNKLQRGKNKLIRYKCVMSAPLVLIVLSRHQCVIYEFSKNATDPYHHQHHHHQHQQPKNVTGSMRINSRADLRPAYSLLQIS